MLVYIDRDPTGDISIRDATTHKTICYMPQTCKASGATAKFAREVEKNAETIVKALNLNEGKEEG